MFAEEITCTNCGEKYGLEFKSGLCGSCGNPLEFRFDYEKLKESLDIENLAGRPKTIWRYFEFFPIENLGKVVSLGEGYTPLIKARRLGLEIGLKNLYLKLDCFNPTGSFKDRGESVALSRAVELGLKGVVGFSTGNAGVSQAAYAAKAGLKSYIFVPETVTHEKIYSMAVYGSKVFIVKGTFEDAFHIALKVSRERGYLLNGGILNPTRLEGKKSIAYEIYEQLNRSVPDWYVQAVGVGTAAIATWKGFKELVEIGWTDLIPRIGAVQAEGCAPMAKAFETGSREIAPVEKPTTIASSIAVTKPLGWPLLRKAIRETGGTVKAVSDHEILKAERELATLEGVWAEPAASAPLALIKRGLNEGLIDKDETVVLMVSGTGLKDIKAAEKLANKPIQISNELDVKKQIDS